MFVQSRTGVPNARRSPVAAATAAMASLAVLLASAGCNGDRDKVTLPPSTTRTVPTPPATPSQSAEDMVKAAYTEFATDSRKAILAPPDQVRQVLSKYSTGDYLELQIRSARKAQKENHVPWGTGAVVHVTKVEVTGTKATVGDCQDARNHGLMDKSTGKRVAGTGGTARQGLRAQLQLGGDGRWRVSKLENYPESCSGS